MLSRAADSLFWLARYMERMDCLARLLDAAQRIAAFGGAADEWKSAIIAAGCEETFFAKHEVADAENAVRFLAYDRENRSSILNCVVFARANARAMRTALTRDMWDAVNETWLEARQMDEKSFTPEQLPRTLDWVRQRATTFNGAYLSTMLRSDSYWFTRLGTFLERADNTARILDVKYNVLLPSYSGVGGMLDYYQWTSILQAVSAVRAYHWVYKEKVKPARVADLLILRPEMPRSLRACYDEMENALERLALAYGGRRGPCHVEVAEIAARLRAGDAETIIAGGLHEFLTEMIDSTAELGEKIGEFYLL